MKIDNKNTQQKCQFIDIFRLMVKNRKKGKNDDKLTKYNIYKE